MSVELVNGEQVHYPKRRDVFTFDDEVSAVFDDMAPRSIPMYNEVHRMHVSLYAKKLKAGAVVADVGSSTGHLFRNIERHMGKTMVEAGIKGYAVDISAYMMDRLTAQFAAVEAIVGDLVTLPDLPEPADLMFCLYTLQFIPLELRFFALEWLVRNVKVGGVLVLGQKETIEDPRTRKVFDDEYYQFRRDNGYTQEEIDAKTAALKGSMFPVPHNQLLNELSTLHVNCIETSRWLQFSTVAGVRRR